MRHSSTWWRRASALGMFLALGVGVLAGLGFFTFSYGEGWSYFSTDPRACVNCHVMQPEYDAWQHSSHHAVAGCIDCHLPHALVPKYLAKADNGWRHSWAFTFQDFHEPIQMHPRSRAILQHNCTQCHETTVHAMLAGRPEEQAPSCVRCHADVGHGPS
ncbi:MAG: cytochrome c nitrite reductase small subunit [Planctomycetes bacterium]|nr:cytochrome c nitrite reductase small subunit [Planctomycetota bacterium]